MHLSSVCNKQFIAFSGDILDILNNYPTKNGSWTSDAVKLFIQKKLKNYVIIECRDGFSNAFKDAGHGQFYFTRRHFEFGFDIGSDGRIERVWIPAKIPF